MDVGRGAPGLMVAGDDVGCLPRAKALYTPQSTVSRALRSAHPTGTAAAHTTGPGARTQDEAQRSADSESVPQ